MYRSALATVTNPDINIKDWSSYFKGKSGVRLSSAVNKALASEKYLLTHSTIVCSVDTEEGENDVPYKDYLVTANTEQYINGNSDAFERRLLNSSYKSFLTASVYTEHVQLQDLAKGHIVDVVARDTGDSLYVDLLMATNRKFGQLCSDIEAGSVNSLSMGANCSFSSCTICGHVTDLTGTGRYGNQSFCEHILALKGSQYYSDGRHRHIAELLGHHTCPESVVFVDASWVLVPAFKGAVVHKIVSREAEVDGRKVISLENIANKAATTNEPRDIQYGDVVKLVKHSDFNPEMPIGEKYLLVDETSDGMITLLSRDGVEYNHVQPDTVVPAWGPAVRNYLWPNDTFNHFGSLDQTKINKASLFGFYGLLRIGTELKEALEVVKFVDSKNMDSLRFIDNEFYREFAKSGMTEGMAKKYMSRAKLSNLGDKYWNRLEDFNRSLIFLR